MGQVDFNRDAWFRLTKEEQDGYIEKLIQDAVEDGEVSLFTISNELIPHFIEKEEYELVDLLERIHQRITDELRWK